MKCRVLRLKCHSFEIKMVLQMTFLSPHKMVFPIVAIIIAIAASTAVFLVMNDSVAKSVAAPSSEWENITRLTAGITVKLQPSNSGLVTPAALLSLGDGAFLVANYWNIFLVDTNTGKISRTSVSMGDVRGVYMPTGLAKQNAAASAIFIANYQGNNILDARYDRASNHLSVVGEVGDSKTISPEGIAMSGGLLASANYDGNNVEVFRRDDGRWSTICNLPVKWAHGVTFAGGSLCERVDGSTDSQDRCRQMRNSQDGRIARLEAREISLAHRARCLWQG